MSLIIGLLLLVLLSLLALAGMGVSTLEERMASNSQDRIIAFNAAEAALRDCESALQGVSLPALGVWQVHTITPAGASTAPRCIIEELPNQPGAGGNDSLAAGKPIPDNGMYRITAEGVGAKPGTVVMLQSTYVR
ncbi:MAG: PilX N-terminal domain-containing pilus assembly protein [Thiobacillaceae bacterium]